MDALGLFCVPLLRLPPMVGHQPGVAHMHTSELDRSVQLSAGGCCFMSRVSGEAVESLGTATAATLVKPMDENDDRATVRDDNNIEAPAANSSGTNTRCQTLQGPPRSLCKVKAQDKDCSAPGRAASITIGMSLVRPEGCSAFFPLRLFAGHPLRAEHH